MKTDEIGNTLEHLTPPEPTEIILVDGPVRILITGEAATHPAEVEPSTEMPISATMPQTPLPRAVATAQIDRDMERIELPADVHEFDLDIAA